MDLENFGIVLEAETTDCTIEIYLNGLPAGLCGIGGSRALSRPIHEYLIDGENELEVLVNPGDTPATAMYFSRQSQPASGAQPPPDAAMDAFNEARREDDRKDRLAAASKAKQNDGKESKNGDENNENNTEENNEDEKSTLSFSVKLTLYPVGGIAGADGGGETLIGIDWNARDSAEILGARNPVFPLADEKSAGARMYPILLTTKKDLGEMFGAPHWLNAKPQTLDEKTIDEVTDFVMHIRDLIEEGDAEPILAISTEMYREVAAAYGISAEERANLFRQLLQQESQKPHWMFETPDEEDFSFRLCAGNRLIECVGPDWKPIIRGVPSPEGRFLYSMLIGKLNGEWLIMR